MYKKIERISKKIQRNLLCCVVAAFAIATAASFMMNTKMSRDSTKKLLMTNIDDICDAVHETDSTTILVTTLRCADYFDAYKSFEPSTEFLAIVHSIATGYNIDEINFIDNDGIIISSNKTEYLGYDMSSAAQSKEFLVLLNDSSTKTFIQGLRENGYGKEKFRYAGAVFKKHKGFIQLGISGKHYDRIISNLLKGSTRYRRIGDNGSMFIFDKDLKVISSPKGFDPHNLQDIGIDKAILLGYQPSTIFEANINGISCYCMYKVEQGCIVLATQPVSEATLTRNNSVILSSINVFIIFLVLFIVIWWLLKRLVVNNIDKVNNSLTRITKGHLEEVIDVRDSYEFDSLSTDINNTVDRLKTYIHEAETRMDADLALAKAIQLSVLPNEFPAYPNNKEFDVFAKMTAAKIVGGDFYDFYFSSEDKFTFTIADVSGKGIPAAMFMMRGKSILKNIISTGTPLDKACNKANRSLCQNNETITFFTGWIGTIDLKTGVVTYINAGHNLPLIRKNGGEFVFLPCQPGIPMAIEDFEYKTETIQLNPGDELLLYTDGVTEATNTNRELFGDDRLIESLKKMPLSQAGKPHDVCDYLLKEVKRFANGAEQSDDITMLCFKYIGPQ